jgi:hypothetical protein
MEIGINCFQAFLIPTGKGTVKEFELSFDFLSSKYYYSKGTTKKIYNR